jgi:hypothetical protein
MQGATHPELAVTQQVLASHRSTFLHLTHNSCQWEASAPCFLPSGCTKVYQGVISPCGVPMAAVSKGSNCKALCASRHCIERHKIWYLVSACHSMQMQTHCGRSTRQDTDTLVATCCCILQQRNTAVCRPCAFLCFAQRTQHSPATQTISYSSA